MKVLEKIPFILLALLIAFLIPEIVSEKRLFFPSHAPGRNQSTFRKSKTSAVLSTFIGNAGTGLTNQRIRLRQFLVIAVEKRRSVFLPDKFFTRKQMLYDFKEKSSWYTVSSRDIFDLIHLSSCLSSLNVDVVGVCQGSDCQVPVTENNMQSFLSLLSNDQALSESSGHIYLGGFITQDLRPQDWSVADVVDECIVYSEPIRSKAIHLWSLFLDKWRPMTTVGLHIRLEDDGAAYFGREKMSLDLYRAAVLDRVTNCIRTLIPPERGPHEDLIFYIATGGTRDLLSGFFSTFPFTSTKDTLDSHFEIISHLGSDGAAGIDHLILLQTDYFFGVS